MSTPLNNLRSECTKCHKNFDSNHTSCNICGSYYHQHCSKKQLVLHRGNSYCRTCLKVQDVIKYNLFYDVIETYTEDLDKVYFQNQNFTDNIENIYPLSNVLEICRIDTIDSLSIDSAKKSLSCKFINIDGNASNFDTLLATLKAINHKFTIIGIAETNVDSFQKDLYTIPGYASIYQDKIPGKKKGSGIAMYLLNSLNFSKCNEYSHITTDLESLFLTVNNENNSMTTIVSTIYRPPNGDLAEFNELLGNIMSNLNRCKKDVIIMGDFNINMFLDNRKRLGFEEVILCNGFIPTISVATHLKPNTQFTCIDNILVNNVEHVTSSGVLETHISHHRSPYLTYKLSCDRRKAHQANKPKTSIRYDFSKENLDLLTKNLCIKLNHTERQHEFSDFTDIFSLCIEESCKLRTTRVSKRNRIQNPWITSALINSISKRDRLYKNWKKSTSKLCKSGDPRRYEKYRTYRNKLSNLIKYAKQRHYARAFQNSSGNVKQTLAIMNELRGKIRTPISSFFTFGNATVTDKKQFANKFNTYFSSIAENLNKDILDDHNTQTSDFTQYLNMAEKGSIFLEDTTPVYIALCHKET